MYNLLQPVVDLTKANIETFSRFATSPEVTEVAKDSATKHLELVQDNKAKLAGSDAFATYLRATIDNYVRFANEHTKNLYGIVSQSQEFMSRQAEEGNKRFTQAADAGTESMKSAGEEAVNEADQVGRARNRAK